MVWKNRRVEFVFSSHQHWKSDHAGEKEKCCRWVSMAMLFPCPSPQPDVTIQWIWVCACVRARPARVYVMGLLHQVLTERIICFYFTHLFHTNPLTYYMTSHENVFFNVSIHIKYPDVPASWAMSISCCTWCGFVNRLWILCTILPPGGWTRKHRKKKISTEESNWKYSIITWLCHSINISN